MCTVRGVPCLYGTYRYTIFKQSNSHFNGWTWSYDGIVIEINVHVRVGAVIDLSFVLELLETCAGSFKLSYKYKSIQRGYCTLYAYPLCIAGINISVLLYLCGTVWYTYAPLTDKDHLIHCNWYHTIGFGSNRKDPEEWRHLFHFAFVNFALDLIARRFRFVYGVRIIQINTWASSNRMNRTECAYIAKTQLKLGCSPKRFAMMRTPRTHTHTHTRIHALTNHKNEFNSSTAKRLWRHLQTYHWSAS